MQEYKTESATKSCTVIAGYSVFHIGAMGDEQAAEGAIFDMTMGINILMSPIVDATRDP